MIDVNPFDDLIVNEPRRLEPAVSGLNERALERLLCRFRQLTAGEVPRPQRRLSHAQLVTSAQPGLANRTSSDGFFERFMGTRRWFTCVHFRHLRWHFNRSSRAS